MVGSQAFPIGFRPVFQVGSSDGTQITRLPSDTTMASGTWVGFLVRKRPFVGMTRYDLLMSMGKKNYIYIYIPPDQHLEHHLENASVVNKSNI